MKKKAEIGGMKKFNSVEEVQEERKEIAEKFSGDLPDYLSDYFDSEELKLVRSEYFRERWHEKSSYTWKEKDKFIEDYNEEFWKNNEVELIKKRKKVGSHLEPVYEEPLKAEERVKQEENLSPAEVSALKQICERDLYVFAVRYFPHYLKYPSSKLHKFLYGLLSRELGDSRKKRRTGFKWAIAAPRGNSKSSVISCILVVWCVVYKKKRFPIMLSDTSGQSSDFLEDVKRELEFNALLNRDFPDACGKGPIWRIGEIITRNSIKVMALGTGNKIRGRKFGIHRPDLLICHEKGTKVFYNNKWVNIEDHPSAFEKMDDGFEIKMWGLPISEVVTKDHKYWCKQFDHKYTRIGNKKTRRFVEKYNGWVNAEDLNGNSYIGYPIDYTILEPQPIDYYSPTIENRDKDTGRIINSISNFVKIIPKEFYDEEFWWLVGLWWGDGYSSGKYALNISVANSQPRILSKVKHILKKYNKGYSITDNNRGACCQVVFCWSVFSRWLKSWRIGNSRKQPPFWVEQIDTKYQKELIKGYIDADGFIDYKNNQVRLTSIHLEGLLSVRRMLLRLGIVSSIRLDSEPKEDIIEDRLINCQRKYDLRFRDNAFNLGYNINNQERYKHKRFFIEDGYLWSKIKKKKNVYNKIFVPIKTEDSTYKTYFGLSHNCDDLESSDMVRSESDRTFIRHQWFDKDVLHAGEPGGITDFFIVGTVLGKDSLLNALLDSSEYPEWKSRRFAAVEKFSTSPLWDEWAQIYSDRFNINSEEDALKFFEEHKEEMLEGVEILWPEGDPYYDLMVLKYFRRSSFETEKQNSPFDPTKVLVTFNQLHFKDFTKDKEVLDILKNKTRRVYYGAIDPSLGKKSDSGDYYCIVTLVRDIKTGVILVVDIELKRKKVDEQIKRILDLHSLNHYKLFAIETNAFQYVIADTLRKLSMAEGLYLPIEEVTQYQDKKMRFEGVIPFILDGTIIFDNHKYKSNQQYNMGIEQITTFTGINDEHDDCPDSLEMAFNVAKKKRFKMITKGTGR
uniref:Putative homing endonuclease n=1 Tax=viral metagenome TaxID=1070528 RepID=A0A6M3JYA4_9ZZZZ